MNIVFDFGRVVFTWDPIPLVESSFQDLETRLRIIQGVFEHPDWLDIDRGTLTLEQLADRASKRCAVPANQVMSMLRQVPNILQPIPESVQILVQLKRLNHKLYALSNMGQVAMAHLNQTYPFLALFDGKVISSEIKCVKPDPEIFRYLIDRFQINPSESIFIDDHTPNIHSAFILGFHTIQFTTPEACVMDLAALGCL